MTEHGWATPLPLKNPTCEPSAEFAFSSNFNAPLPEDFETIIAVPCDILNLDEIEEMTNSPCRPWRDDKSWIDVDIR
jgi:hypothetical protein